MQNKLNSRLKSSVHGDTHCIDESLSRLQPILTCNYHIWLEVVELTHQKKGALSFLTFLTNYFSILFLSLKQTLWLKR